MLMQTYDPETTPAATMIIIVLGVGFALATVFFRAAANWVESSLDVPSRKARATVFYLLLIAVGIVYLPPKAFAMPAVFLLTVPIGLLAQASVFSRRHPVSFRKALLVSLAIAAIPIAVVAITWCVAFIAWNVFSPFWQM